MNSDWFVVYAVGENFKPVPVAVFADEELALDWARDYYPYQYVIGRCPPVASEFGKEVVGVHYNPEEVHSGPP